MALENNTTVKCVERDIRTVIEVIWKYGDRELLNIVAGRELKEKPNNREFIDMLARFVEEEESESKDAAITEADIKEDIKEDPWAGRKRRSPAADAALTGRGAGAY